MYAQQQHSPCFPDATSHFAERISRYMKKTYRVHPRTLAALISLLLLVCLLLPACQNSSDPADEGTSATTEMAPSQDEMQTNPATDDPAQDTGEPGTTTDVSETDTDVSETDTEAQTGSVPVADDGQTNIAILSDVHIGKMNLSPMPEDKFASSLQQINTLFGHTDGLVIVGDLTDRGYDAEYALFTRVLWENAQDDTSVCTVMGNHEYFRDGVVRFGGESETFLKECQTAYSGVMGDLDTDTVVNGIHIIGVSARNSAAQYAGCEQFLISHVQAAAEEDPTMPIIVFAHQGCGELYDTGNGVFDASVRALLNQYPQVIFFSGHTHFAVNDPRMIQQKQYTNIQVPTVGADYWSYSYLDPDQPPESATASQGLLLSVSEDKVVTIRRYDFTEKAFIGQAWVIDVPAVCASSKSFTYTDRRAEEAALPAFPDGAVAEVTAVGQHTAHLSFPAASVEDGVTDGVIMYYHVLVTDKATGVAHFGLDINTDYYMGTARKTTWDCDLSGLRHDTEYTVTVTAESVWGKISPVLSADFRTEFDPDAGEEPTDIPCILDVDYTTGGHDDTASGLTCETYGTPRFENGICVLDKESAYAYLLTDKQYGQLVNSVTLETMIYIEGDQTYPWGYVNLVSNTEAGGFGTSLYNNGDLHFEVNIGGSYKTVVTRAVVGKWVHLVCTYDNSFLRVYMDGELVDSLAATGNIRHVAEVSRKLMVGADVNGRGTTQCISNIRVAFVRLYAGGLSPEKVTELHEAVAYPAV